jgi:hypothetical protein
VQRPIFEGVGSPVVWATLKGASHFTPSSGDWSGFGEAALTFFRWRLKGEAGAARAFEGEDCGLCRDARWIVRRK